MRPFFFPISSHSLSLPPVVGIDEVEKRRAGRPSETGDLANAGDRLSRSKCKFAHTDGRSPRAALMQPRRDARRANHIIAIDTWGREDGARPRGHGARRDARRFNQHPPRRSPSPRIVDASRVRFAHATGCSRICGRCVGTARRGRPGCEERTFP